MGHNFDPSTPGRISGRKFVPRLVAHLHDQISLTFNPFGLLNGQLHGLVAQQGSCPSNGAVKLRGRRAQPEHLHVVPHDFQHLNIASHKDVLTEWRSRLQPSISRTDDDALVGLWHVAILTLSRRFSVVGIRGVQPLVVCCLFHVICTCQIAIQIGSLGHERMAPSTNFRAINMGSVSNVVPNVFHHGLV